MASNHNNESAQRFCASCGIPIDTANQFCRKCGTKRKVAISQSTKITEPRKGDQKLFISIGTGAAIAAVAIIILFVFPFGPIKDTSNGDVNDDIITPITNVTESELLVNENNQFALDFYSKVANKDKTNIFFSPWSISTAFAIAYEGAKGNTAEEIRQVFGFEENDEERRLLFKTIYDKLDEKNANYTLRVANALWLAEDFEPLPEYVDTAKTYYDSQVSAVNFTTDQGVDTINQWVSSKTENKIPQLLDPGSTSADTRLIITNAIYFKGVWVLPFNKDDTRDEDFNGSLEVKVPMMKLTQVFNYGETPQLQILEMPYEGERLSMLVLLPKDVNGLKSLEESLTTENLTLWKNKLHEGDVRVRIPKFAIDTDYDLIPELQDLGISSAFNQNVANFTGIAENLSITKAIHKAFVEVNEEGSEAAGATTIVMEVTTASPDYIPPQIPEFNADHPFIFIIQEMDTGNILFIGRIIDPTQKMNS